MNHVNKKIWLGAIGFFLPAFFPAAQAQDYPAKNIYRTYVEASGKYTDQRAFEDVSGLYSISSGDLLGSFPLIARVLEGKDMTKKRSCGQSGLDLAIRYELA